MQLRDLVLETLIDISNADSESDLDSKLDIITAKAKGVPEAEVMLPLLLTCLLRSPRPDVCRKAGFLALDFIENRVLSIVTVLSTFARWEKNPIPESDPNLGASFYEHIIQDAEFDIEFRKWKQDAVLRKRYIKVGYCLPDNEELSLYEWALNLGELDAVRSSLSTMCRVRKLPRQNVARWLKVFLWCGSEQEPYCAAEISPP